MVQSSVIKPALAPGAGLSPARACVLAAALAVAVWLGLIWLWPAAAFYLPFDDSYYYFEIARNLAGGLGSTFDRLNPTNGYHPLWMAIASAAYALGLDGMVAARALLTLQAGLWLVALGLLIATLRPRPGDAGVFGLPLLIALLAGNPYVVKTFVNGLESGVYVPLYALLIWASARFGGRWLEATTRGQRLALSVAGALLFLARTDGGFLLLAWGLFCLPPARRLGARGIGRLAELFALPAVTIVTYLVANELIFGGAMQVSGVVKRLEPSLAGAVEFVLAVLVPALIIGWLGHGAAVARRFPRLAAFARDSAWFAVGCGMIVGYYIGFQTFPRLWYFGPLIFYGIALFLHLAADLQAMARADGPSQLAMLRAILIAPLAVGLALQVRAAADPMAVSARLANRAAGEWIGAHLPPDAVLGSWDAGILGYFAPQSVINLDGVVNSLAFARGLADDTAGRLALAKGLGYLVNHDQRRNGEPRALPAVARRLLGPEAVAGMRLVKTWPFTFAGRSNRSKGGIHEMAVFLFALDDR